MFFSKPDLDFTSAYVEPTPLDPTNAATWTEQWRAADKETMERFNSVSGVLNLGDAYQKHIDRVKELTGSDLKNPEHFGIDSSNDPDYRQRYYEDWKTYRGDGGTLDSSTFQRMWQEKEFRRQLDELAVKHPEYRTQILPDQSFRSQGLQAPVDAMRRSEDVWQRSNQSTLDWTAWGVGYLTGALRDPVNLAAAPIGFGGAGLGIKGMLSGGLRAAAANAAVEANIQPFVKSYNERAGLPYTWGDAAIAVGSAGLLGGGLDVGIRGAYRAVVPRFGYTPIVKDGVVVSWRHGKASVEPMSPVPEIPQELRERAAQNDKAAQEEVNRLISGGPEKPTTISDAVMRKAADGDPASVRKVYEPEAARDPAVRHMLDAMDADERLNVKPNELIDDTAHAEAVQQTLAHVYDPETEPLPVRVDMTPPETGMRAKLEGEVQSLKEKLAKTPDNAEVAERLAAVESQVKTIDAFGSNPIRDAELIRTNPEIVTGDIAAELPGVRQARALAALSDESFGMVKGGKAPAELGALVANYVAEPAQQARMLTDLTARRPVSPEDGKRILSELLASPDYAPRVEDVPGPVSEAAHSPRQLDDPYGAEAKAQVARLEREMQEELAAGGRADAVEMLSTPEGQTAAIALVDPIKKAIADLAGVIPRDVRVESFSRVDDLPAPLRTKVRAANAKAYEGALRDFENAKSLDERFAAKSRLDASARGEGIEGIALDDTIWIASYAMNPKGRLAHEVLHALKTTGRLSPDEVTILADAARESGIWNRAREETYHAELSSRMDEQGVKEALEEEAAAHYVEAAVNGDLPALAAPQALSIVERLKAFFAQVKSALMGQGFRPRSDDAINPAQDVVTALLAGKIAEREQRADWMRGQVDPAATRAVMDGQAAMKAAAEKGTELPDGTNVNGVPLYAIKAYHGSPHDFDKFSSEHIGKGEGAQAFGHGLYFAERPEVGKSYRDLAGATIGGKPFEPENALHRAVQMVDEFGSREAAVVEAKGRLKYDPGDFHGRVLRHLESGRDLPVMQSQGHLYQVRINANPEDFLDWDKPLSGQSEKVRKALTEKFGLRNPDAVVGRTLFGYETDKAGLTEQLVSDGIPGIRYLDQGSRTAGEGSYNYVVFDDSLIEIIGKNGQPIERVSTSQSPAPINPLPDIQTAFADILDDIQSSALATPAVARDAEGNVNAVRLNGQTYTVSRGPDGNVSGISVGKAPEGGSFEITRDPAGQIADVVAGNPDLVARVTERVSALLTKYRGAELDVEATTALVNRVMASVGNGEDFQTALTKELQAYYGPRGGSEPRFAMRTDQDELGYTSKALEVARTRLQAKGTPEQMLATLRNNGVRPAEIEATGLDKFLSDRSGSSAGTGEAKSGEVTLSPSKGDRSDGKAGANGRLNQITRDEIIKYLEEKRVGLKEARYGDPPYDVAALVAEAKALEPKANSILPIPGRAEARRRWQSLREQIDLADVRTERKTKFSSHSLDPSNPTYRETVLHLQEFGDEAIRERMAQMRKEGIGSGGPHTWADFEAVQGELGKSGDWKNFRSGHFPEPNIVGHYQSETVLHNGKKTVVPTQLQSDWGQRLRDGGVRDEAKIADLKEKIASAKEKNPQSPEEIIKHLRDVASRELYVMPLSTKLGMGHTIRRRHGEENFDLAHASYDITMALDSSAGFSKSPKTVAAVAKFPKIQKAAEKYWAAKDVQLLEAELRTAEASAPGHPLVNTTDQWTNTVLRRVIRQAVDENAEYIAIPHGDTVLSYNPGDTHGMRDFYGSRTSEGIVPKNLRKLLEKLDKDTPKPERVEKLETPSGPKGFKTGYNNLFDVYQTGFTVFKLTAKAKSSLRDEGQPMFAMTTAEGRKKPGAAQRSEDLTADLADIELALKGASIDDREALQRKRAALINAKAHEVGLEDAYGYKDPLGRQDPAMGFMRMHETHGEGGATDVATLKQVIQDQALQKMAEVMWTFRKGAILGDLRRTANPNVKAKMDNVIREAAGEKTGDAAAARMAKAWLDTADWLRQSFNGGGGDIGKLKGWFAPQYHDAEAWLRAGRDTVVEYLMKPGVLDRDRMTRFDGTALSDKELREMLREVWVTITTDGANKRDVTSYRGKGALYKRHADHRVLHFKTADAYLSYARDFGSADPYAMMIGHINMMARDIASLRRFGANPELVRERIKQQLIIDAETDVTAKSLYQDLTEKVEELRTKAGSLPDKADAAMKKLGKLHEELDTLIGKSRKKAQREELGAKLGAAHDDLRDALTNGPLAPDHLALYNEISALLDEMYDVRHTYKVVTSNPVERVNRILQRADEMWKVYSGTTNTPLDSRMAAFMSGARNVISAGTLPFASISALSDQATGLAARAFIGMPVTKQLGSFLKGFTKEDRKFALRAGLGLDQAMNAFTMQSRFVGYVNTKSVTGYLADRTHAFSFLSPMTQAAKVAFGSDFMAWMADLAATRKFGGLEPWTREMLIRHGLTEADWMKLKTVTPETHRGVPVLTQTAISASAGDDLAEKFMMMLLRERAQAVLEPTIQGRTAFISESRPGTVMGELTRSVAMLKSFPTSYMMLVMGRAYNEIVAGKGMRPNTVAYMTAILVGGTLLGAMAKQMKSVTQGRDPEDMTDAQFWGRAFMQSGGLGIYGDFIANSVNRNGGGLAQTLMGPVADRGATVLDATVGNVVQYAKDEKTNAGREMVRLLRQNTPGALVPFYLRAAYERMVLDELQKAVDPDAAKSFRSRINATKKLSGTDYYWPPGSPVPHRAPNFSSAFGARQ